MADNAREELEYSPSSDKNGAILGTLEGPCADIINPTRNGRKYSAELWEKVFNNDLVLEAFNNGGIFGELGHPTDRTETDMEKIAICMPKPPKKNNKGELVGRWDILNTPNGRILKCLCDYGYKVGISSRGTGEVIEGYNGEEEVDPDSYDFTAFDIVLLPAVKTARLSLVSESLDTNKQSLKRALCEAIEKSGEDEKKVMVETLQDLKIDYLPEVADDKADTESDTTAEDNGVTLVKDLHEAIRAKKELDDKVTKLQEKLSVCYAKETKYEEELEKLRESVSSLTESANKAESLKARIDRLVCQLKTKDKSIAEKDASISKLNEDMSRLNTANKALSERVSEKTATATSLGERISSLEKEKKDADRKAIRDKSLYEEQIKDLRRDLSMAKSEYSDKLAKANAVTEKYRKIAKASIDKYIESKASILGVSSQDIKNRLSENYSFDEIDRVCESMKSYRVNMSRLPFETSTLKKNNVTVKVTESKEPILPSYGLDDEVDSSLMGLIGG